MFRALKQDAGDQYIGKFTGKKLTMLKTNILPLNR